MRDSIAAAKAAQQAERDAVYRATGLRITDAPIVVPPRAVLVLCPSPGCRHAASARTEGRAIRSIAVHLVRAHGRQDS